MSSVAELLKQMRAKHDAMNDRIAEAPDSQMDAAGDWGDRKLPIRLMTFQLLGHEVEHTIQAVKPFATWESSKRRPSSSWEGSSRRAASWRGC